jgi:Zn-finger nucleic acid-binding protein
MNIFNEKTVICPKCKCHPLTTQEENEFPFVLETCSRCNGAWFDVGELAQALDNIGVSGLKIPEKAGSTLRRCPHCEKTMMTFYYPQTYARIDMCRKCHGIWLDAKEFEEINIVREKLRKDGILAGHPSITGVSRSLIELVNKAVEGICRITDHHRQARTDTDD